MPNGRVHIKKPDGYRVSKKLGDGLQVFGNATMVADERFWTWIEDHGVLVSVGVSWVTSAAEVAASWLESAISDIGKSQGPSEWPTWQRRKSCGNSPTFALVRVQLWTAGFFIQNKFHM